MTASEIERVRYLTSQLFGGQSGRWSITLDGATVELIGGADRRDDAAWYRIRGDTDLVVASDYVRGSKFTLFELGLLDHFDIGFYLISANVSDIAAMGASPIGVTTVVRYPVELPEEQFQQILLGIRAACDEYDIHNVGGDIGSAERIVLSASAMGVADVGHVIPRSGARVGDLVAISGQTGLAAAALLHFEAVAQGAAPLGEEDEARLLLAWKRPRAAVKLGALLGARSLATSCQDTSDGLRATLEEIGEQSGVGFEVDQWRLPIDPLVARVAETYGRDAVELTCGASVDFRLAFTIDPHSNAVDEILAEHPEVVVIGRAVSGSAVTLRETVSGASRELPGVAWLHTR